MCLALILKLFHKPKLKLPHPEEKPDYAQTMENTRISDFYNIWFRDWAVPEPQHLFWQTQINIKLSVEIFYPAGTWSDSDGNRHMICRPEWMNAGVIAHENAHNSYALLTPEEKAAFDIAFAESLVGDDLVMFLDKQNDYMNTNNTEGHAEVYRYCGNEMPECLKQFYPRLF